MRRPWPTLGRSSIGKKEDYLSSFGVQLKKERVPILICATTGDIHFTSKLLVISNFVSAV
jgi:hypothetical protein